MLAMFVLCLHCHHRIASHQGREGINPSRLRPATPPKQIQHRPFPIKFGASGQREPRSLMAVSGHPPRDASTPLPHKVNCAYDHCRSYGCHIANMACSNNLRMRRRVLVLGILHAERHNIRSADASESAGCVARCFMCLRALRAMDLCERSRHTAALFSRFPLGRWEDMGRVFAVAFDLR